MLGADLLVFVEVLLERTTPKVFEAAVPVYLLIMVCHRLAGD